jgi:hypothetical protein
MSCYSQFSYIQRIVSSFIISDFLTVTVIGSVTPVLQIPHSYQFSYTSVTDSSQLSVQLHKCYRFQPGTSATTRTKQNSTRWHPRHHYDNESTSVLPNNFQHLCFSLYSLSFYLPLCEIKRIGVSFILHAIVLELIY